MRRLLQIFLIAAAFGAGVTWSFWFPEPEPQFEHDPSLMLQIREIARLETLELKLYKKISFSPEPEPSDSVWKDVLQWAKFSMRAPRGKAIVFARVQLGVDISKLDADSMRVRGPRIELVLPPLRPQVELLPGETEIIGSNLNSEETAQLFELAKEAFEREVDTDLELKKKARDSAERALRHLLRDAGFREVHFVERLPSVASG